MMCQSIGAMPRLVLVGGQEGGKRGGRGRGGGLVCAYLALRHKNGNVLVETGGNGKVGDALDAQSVPWDREIVAVVELNLIGNEAGAELLVGRVLKVPARHLLLDPLAEGLLDVAIAKFLNGAPDLEVLCCISVLILANALPGADVGAARGEGHLVDEGEGHRRQNVADRGVDDYDAVISGVGKVASAWRVNATPKIPLGLDEPRKGFVDRRGVEDTNSLLGPVGKLQRAGHD